MNDQQIYMLMARTPNIRAVQIADALDVDLLDASNAMRSLVEVGDVVVSKGFSPNGLPSQVYNFSDAFKKSRDYGVVMALVAAEDAKAKLLSAPTTTPAPKVNAPVFSESTIMPVSQGSKADRGVAYIIERGCATDSELRAVMGIAKPGAPSAYLIAAVRTGKVHKAADGWRPGRSAPAAGAPFNQRITKANPGPVAQFGKHEQPVDSAPAPLERPRQDPDVFVEVKACDQTATPVFRCGLWSDGVIELQRDGVQVGTLTRGEGEHLHDFLGRMWSGVAAMAPV